MFIGFEHGDADPTLASLGNTELTDGESGGSPAAVEHPRHTLLPSMGSVPTTLRLRITLRLPRRQFVGLGPNGDRTSLMDTPAVAEGTETRATTGQRN